jgi:hypothetical protein
MPLVPAPAVAIKILPKWEALEAPLTSSMLPPVALTGLKRFLMEAVSVVDPESI